MFPSGITDSLIPNLSDGSGNESDWETCSDDSLDRPLPKHQTDFLTMKLTEVPMHVLTESESISWLAPMLNFKHEHKCYEHLMVSMLNLIENLS